MTDRGMPTVIALAGPNGAGKTTAGPDLLRDTLGIRLVVNADMIAQGLAGFAPEVARVRAGRILLEQVDRLARGRENFAFETTLAGRAYARRLRKMISMGYAFYIVFLWLPSPALAVARVQDRVRRGGHDVPEVLIRRRYEAGLRNLFALYRPLAQQWRLYDSSRTRPELVAAGQRNTIDRILDHEAWADVRRSMETPSHE